MREYYELSLETEFNHIWNQLQSADVVYVVDPGAWEEGSESEV